MLSAMEHRMTAPLRWRDLDVQGHLNQAVYHELLEDVRSGLLSDFMHDDHAGFVMVRVELDYRSEVRIADSPVELVARVAKVGTKSFTLDHEVIKADGTVAAAGQVTCVAWDHEQRTSRALTDDERAALTP
jgi:acyl-CoA thioester hydrolase